jgi:hypothetical protein
VTAQGQRRILDRYYHDWKALDVAATRDGTPSNIANARNAWRMYTDACIRRNACITVGCLGTPLPPTGHQISVYCAEHQTPGVKGGDAT